VMRVRTVATVGFLVAAGGVLQGCALRHTSEARTYVLDAMSPSASSEKREGSPVAVVGVDKVTVPGWIDRPQITSRSAGGEVVTDEYARWGEPISRGIQRVLAENLAGLLADRRLVSAPYPPGIDPDQRVLVAISEAARQADGSVLVEARWSVVAPGGKVLASGRSSQRTPGGAAAAGGIVAGLNQALAGLSREIAEGLPR